MKITKVAGFYEAEVYVRMLNIALKKRGDFPRCLGIYSVYYSRCLY